MNPAVFQQRRQRLAEQMQPNSIAIIATSPEVMRNRDADYRFRADSSFYYLTGFAEPDAVAVLERGENTLRYTLFCRTRNPELELWTGRRAGLDGALKQFGADQSFAIDELDQHIVHLLQGKQALYMRLGQRLEFDQKLSAWLNTVASNQRHGGAVPEQIIQLDTLLDEMRLFKRPEEVTAMQHAVNVSALAHRRAMQMVRPEMMEYALEAELLYIFHHHGGVPAYNSIVGGGKNACILHYVDNNQRLQDGDLVLIDAAAEIGLYAADITRTFPVNGKFSPEQAALYNLVLQAQLAAIDATQVGRHYREPHNIAVQILTEGLVALGLLVGEVQELISSEAYRRFYMHGTGHWLGMDVHDVGAYKLDGQWRLYQAGMVVTVEPGLYIAPDDDTVDAKWRGIGIRIEDDVLVTEQGPQVLSAGVPKTIAEIEALMAGQKQLA